MGVVCIRITEDNSVIVGRQVVYVSPAQQIPDVNIYNPANKYRRRIWTYLAVEIEEYEIWNHVTCIMKAKDDFKLHSTRQRGISPGEPFA